MTAENKFNISTIVLIGVAFLLLGGIIFAAWKSPAAPKEETRKLEIKEVQAAEFDAEVVKSDKLTVVDAYAPWCPHCQKLAPVMEEVAAEYEGRVKFLKLNADNQDPAQKANFDFAVSNGLKGYPTVWFYKEGKIAESFSGERSKEEIKEIVDKLLQ